MAYTGYLSHPLRTVRMLGFDDDLTSSIEYSHLSLLDLPTVFASSRYRDAFCSQKPLLGSAGNCVHFPSLLDVDVEDLAAGLEKGSFTTTIDLVNAYTRRILEVNSTLKAVTQLNASALSIALELDAARTNGRIMGSSILSSAGPVDKIPDYVALRGARIGVPRNLIELDDPAFDPYAPVLPAFEAALSVLRSAGAIIINDLFLPGYETTKKEQFVFENLVSNTDFPRIATCFSQLTVNPQNLTSLKDIERFT
ncbi:hypothetical protein GE21DRAFT_2348 [Neurospora crassa]|uniref:Amidase domain-containing protein n=1 Tax=Neurospora crassa (strain ATCC 24698 / 74-OR23-1A / CBS 708.71 / DSM 1257 / FGSC 987) TaxID=367110 RepID=Q7SHF7_NEUCR|nr:hypothetical protein NCU02947 [Neurospora crassa OR74A]EAA36393.2 hypothetical protein NCU02947 [Neurospora crassa OR74A]KHE89277.1 hypothetical protein GE21DRAFT_2348 [Neurospora crassa]|eukprot:XP_965629.2 hypothetical protein NCU02947 [Neurospora crassa OR74A]